MTFSPVDDLQNFWFKYVDDFTFYPVDCVFTQSELDDLDLYKPDFENHVKEQEALWFRDGGPSDAEWEAYKQDLIDTYGMGNGQMPGVDGGAGGLDGHGAGAAGALQRGQVDVVSRIIGHQLVDLPDQG